MMDDAKKSTPNVIFGLGRAIPPGYRDRICEVRGTLIKARGLMDLDAFGKSDPYALIKGIKGNGRMVFIARTPVMMDNLNPEWKFDFRFECPQEWGYTELVGVKFLVFDSDEGGFDNNDDFLGGCDVDIADDKDFPSNQTIHKDVELAGLNQGKKKQKQGLMKKRKSRIEFDITVFRCVEPAPILRPTRMIENMEPLIRIQEIEGCIVSASGLRDADIAGKSDPRCIVRLKFLNGVEREIARTATINDTLDPVWNESFHLGFTRHEEPAVLMFDIYDVDEGEVGGGDDDHLGGVTVLLSEILEQELQKVQRFVMELQALKGSGAQDLGDGGGFMKKKKGLGNITLELFAHAVKEPMPHVKLLKPPEEKVEGEKLIPAPFAKPEEDHAKAKKVNVKKPLGVERVTFLSGRVLFATNLIDADAWGKSDPFCVVDCPIKDSNVPLDVHRTRTLNDDLNPVWNETFSCVIPDDLDIRKVIFSVYDDDDEGEDEGVYGDFLGRVSVDLNDLGQGQVCREEAPLVGVKKKRAPGQGTRAGGFKRDSTLAYEIRVERRIFKLPEEKVDNSAEAQSKRLGMMMTVPRHLESRRPDLSVYRAKNLHEDLTYYDSSQEVVQDSNRATAQRVMQLRDFNVWQMAATASSGWSKSSAHGGLNRIKKWLRPKELQSRWAGSTSESFFKPPLEEKKEFAVKDMSSVYKQDSAEQTKKPSNESEGPKRRPRDGPDYDMTGLRLNSLAKSKSLPRVPIISTFGPQSSGRPSSEQRSIGGQGLSRMSTPNFSGGVDPGLSLRELRVRPPIMMFDRR